MKCISKLILGNGIFEKKNKNRIHIMLSGIIINVERAFKNTFHVFWKFFFKTRFYFSAFSIFFFLWFCLWYSSFVVEVVTVVAWCDAVMRDVWIYSSRSAVTNCGVQEAINLYGTQKLIWAFDTEVINFFCHNPTQTTGILHSVPILPPHWTDTNIQ